MTDDPRELVESVLREHRPHDKIHPHSLIVEWGFNAGPSYHFECTALEGSFCRMTCAQNTCEGWGPDGCEHGLVDSGSCIVTEWLNAADAEESVAHDCSIAVPIDYEWDEGPLWFFASIDMRSSSTASSPSPDLDAKEDARD